MGEYTNPLSAYTKEGDSSKSPGRAFSSGPSGSRRNYTTAPETCGQVTGTIVMVPAATQTGVLLCTFTLNTEELEPA